MLLEIVVAVVGANLALTVANAWQIWRLRVQGNAGNDRVDRYAAAALHSEGQYAAAKAVAPPAKDAEKVLPLQRPRQIGMTPR